MIFFLSRIVLASLLLFELEIKVVENSRESPTYKGPRHENNYNSYQS